MTKHRVKNWDTNMYREIFKAIVAHITKEYYNEIDETFLQGNI